MAEGPAQPYPFDYDSNPERFRAARRVVERYGVAGDVHEPIAERFLHEKIHLALDIGCGEGRLLRALRPLGITGVGLDRSPVLLAHAPRPTVLGEACSLPFADSVFDAAAAVYMLYHLADPLLAIREAHRVLRRGGLLVAVAPSRFDSPETAKWEQFGPSTFDAELAPTLVGSIFSGIEVDKWDGPFIQLPDSDGLSQYLVGRGMSRERARLVSESAAIHWPLSITKRGALVYGWKA